MDYHFSSPGSQHKSLFSNVCLRLIYLHSTFITSDRVIIRSITAGREEMQMNKLLYRVEGTQTSPL